MFPSLSELWVPPAGSSDPASDPFRPAAHGAEEALASPSAPVNTELDMDLLLSSFAPTPDHASQCSDALSFVTTPPSQLDIDAAVAPSTMLDAPVFPAYDYLDLDLALDGAVPAWLDKPAPAPSAAQQGLCV